MEVGSKCLVGNWEMNLTREYSLDQVVASFEQAYTLCFGLFLWSLMSQFLVNWVVVKGKFFGIVEVVFHKVVGDDSVYGLDSDMEVVIDMLVGLGNGMGVGSGMLVEDKYRWNGGNSDMVGVEDLHKIVLHGVGNHGDSF